MAGRPDVLVAIRGLKTYYSLRGSFVARLLGREAGHVRAVDDVTIDLHRGEVLGLVGESGSGKTTLGRTIIGLVSATAGSVEFDGREITRMSERELRHLRREMQIVFQDPHASLNPAMTIAQLVEHPLQIHRIGTKSERQGRVAEFYAASAVDDMALADGLANGSLAVDTRLRDALRAIRRADGSFGFES